MVEHLQKSLVQIAHRVMSRHQNSSSTIFDQQSSVLFVDSNGSETYSNGDEQDDKKEDEDEVVAALDVGSYYETARSIRKLVSKEDAKSFVKEVESGSDFLRRHFIKAETEAESGSDFIRRHLAEEEPEYHNNDNSNNNHDDGDVHEGETEGGEQLYKEYLLRREEDRDTQSCEVEAEDLAITDCLAQVACSLPLGAYYLNKRIMTKVSSLPHTTCMSVCLSVVCLTLHDCLKLLIASKSIL
jgi:hypothetical protein